MTHFEGDDMEEARTESRANAELHLMLLAVIMTVAFLATELAWGAPVITISKTALPINPPNGSPVQFQIVVTNTGMETVTDLKVVDTFPMQFTYSSEAHPLPGSIFFSLIGQLGSWNGTGLNMEMGESLTFTVTGATSLCYTGTVSNTAWACGTNAMGTDQEKAVAAFNLAVPATSVSIWKDAVPANPCTGGPISYVVTVLNTGAATLTDVKIVDTAPLQFTYTGHEEPGALNFNWAGSVFSWNGFGITLGPNQRLTATLTGITSTLFTGTVSNTAWVYAWHSCGSAQNKSVASFYSSPCAPAYPGWTDQRINGAKTATAAPGDTLSYTIKYNIPSSTLTAIQLVETLPAYTHYVWGSASPAPDVGWDPAVGPPMKLRWTFAGPFTGGTTGTITFDLTVDWGNGDMFEPGSGNVAAPQGTVLAGRAQAAWDWGAGGTESATSPATTADIDWMTLTKSPTGSGDILYTIVARNRSALKTWWNVRIWDTVPAGLDAWATDCGHFDPCTGWTMTPTGCPVAAPGSIVSAGATILTWTLDMAPNSSVYVHWKGRLNPCAASATVSNTAAVRAQGQTGVMEGTGDSVNPVAASATAWARGASCCNAGISMVKSVNPPAPASGEALKYSIIVTNTGAVTLDSFVITDTMPGAVSYVSSTATAGLVHSSAGLVHSWSGTLAAPLGLGESASVIIDGTAASCFAGFVSNTAFAAGSWACGSTTAKAIDAGFELYPSIIGVSAFNTHSPASPAPGTPVTYRILVTNTGTETLTSIKVTDTLPSTLSFTGQSSSPTLTWNASAVIPSWEGTISLGTGQTATIQVDATVNTCGAYVSNTAWIEVSNGCGDSASRAIDSGFTPAGGATAVAIAAAVTPAAPAGGAPVTYRIVVTNTGTTTLTNVLITDTMPAGFTYAGEEHDAGLGFSPAGDLKTWSGGTLGPSRTFTVTVYGTAGACLTGSVTNTPWTAVMSACGNAQARDFATFTSTDPATAIAVVKSVSPAAPVQGGPVSYRIIVTNNGAATVTSLLVTDTLPSQVSFSGQSSSPALTHNGNLAGVAAWSGALSLGPGKSATITLDGTVGSCTAGTVTNTAWIRAAGSCGTDTRTAGAGFTLASPSMAATVQITNVPGAPGNGAAFSYLITVTNAGTIGITSLVLSDTVPAGVTYTGEDHPASLGFTQLGDLLVWSGAVSLTTGESLTVTVTGTTSACYSGSVVNRATAEYIACDWQRQTGSNSFILAGIPVDVSIRHTVSPSSGKEGAPVTYRVVLTNNGTAVVTDLKVVETIPAGLSFLAEEHPAGVTFNGGGGRAAWNGTGLSFAPGGTLTFTVTGRITSSEGEVRATAWFMAADACNGDQATATAVFSLPPPVVIDDNVKIVGGIRGYIEPKNGEQANILVRPERAGDIRVRIYGLDGTLVWETTVYSSGRKTEVISWRAVDMAGDSVPAGVYPILIEGPGVSYRDRLVVVR